MGATLASLSTTTLLAQDSAPSSHLVFDDDFPGDILVNEVRVPESGHAMYTYYETLGWRGPAGGYAGIQVHPRGHNFIFSIWDHQAHRAPIKAVHQGPGTLVERFGGEGTGLKSWNFELGWKTDVWHTLVARCWKSPAAADDSAQSTDFGFWARAGDTGKWTHLVTMRVATADVRFEGGTDVFIEDWLNTGVHARTIQVRNGWKRAAKDGVWRPLQKARYSVNAWDLTEGKRSYNYRAHWNGGVGKDADGEHFFMVAGGKDTAPQVANPSTLAAARADARATSPRHEPAKLARLAAKRQGEHVRVEWQVDPTMAPPFAYQLELHADGATAAPLSRLELTNPAARTAELPAAATGDAQVVRIRVRDLFDHWSPWQTLAVKAVE
ncbi:MAG: DUF3472 domain-containing protein [Planctomycetales bacterium]|nr:DUF3472 domain-containing protein [Planctomycetales bacterium]